MPTIDSISLKISPDITPLPGSGTTLFDPARLSQVADQLEANVWKAEVTMQISSAASELGSRVPTHEAFELSLPRADLFPNRRRPRVVACELVPEEPLAALAHTVKEGVSAAGLPTEERAFRGHLTLGRFRDPRSELDVTASDTAVSDPLPVTEVVLFRSKLQRSGALHTPLGQAALRPPSVAFTPNSTKNHKKGSKRHG